MVLSSGRVSTELTPATRRRNQEIIPFSFERCEKLSIRVLSKRQRMANDLSRPSQTLCKLPEKCRIEASHRR